MECSVFQCSGFEWSTIRKPNFETFHFRMDSVFKCSEFNPRLYNKFLQKNDLTFCCFTGCGRATFASFGSIILLRKKHFGIKRPNLLLFYRMWTSDICFVWVTERNLWKLKKISRDTEGSITFSENE